MAWARTGYVLELPVVVIQNMALGYNGRMATTTTRRAAIYARISLDKQEEAGVKRQIHLATKQAEAD